MMIKNFKISAINIMSPHLKCKNNGCNVLAGNYLLKIIKKVNKIITAFINHQFPKNTKIFKR